MTKLLRTSKLFVLLMTVLLCGCGTYVDRSYFASKNGLTITNPRPDKDGTWWMPIEYRDEPVNSAKQVIAWDAEVISSEIFIRAKVALVKEGVRTPSGVTLKDLKERTYKVSYRNSDGTAVPIIEVQAKYDS